MLLFYLTTNQEEKTIFRVAVTEYDAVLKSKSYKIISEKHDGYGNTFNVKAKKIGENMVHLYIDEIHLVDTSEVFAIIANEISLVNMGNVIPVNISQNKNTAIVFFENRQ